MSNREYFITAAPLGSLKRGRGPKCLIDLTQDEQDAVMSEVLMFLMSQKPGSPERGLFFDETAFDSVVTYLAEKLKMCQHEARYLLLAAVYRAANALRLDASERMHTARDRWFSTEAACPSHLMPTPRPTTVSWKLDELTVAVQNCAKRAIREKIPFGEAHTHEWWSKKFGSISSGWGSILHSVLMSTNSIDGATVYWLTNHYLWAEVRAVVEAEDAAVQETAGSKSETEVTKPETEDEQPSWVDSAGEDSA